MQYKVLFKRCLLAIVVMFVVTSLQAQREMKTINDNWEFRKSIDESWESVNLPHTFNIDAYQQRNYYQGKGFYRRTLVLPEIVAERRYYMKIDAASKAANIRVNGKEVGSHVGGYTACIVDITEYIRKENLIEITVDNGRKDITPISADFTFWGGIYRDVWLISTPKQHFNMSNMGSDGIFISTPVVNEKRGVLKVKCEVTNDSHESSILEVRSAIYSPQGKLLQTIKQKQKLKSGETYIFENTSGAIESPDLWSPETPSLYLVKTTLVDPKSGKLLDEKNHKVGFRWFTFDGSKGFFLNGKSYKLRGLNRHQDQAPAGVALDDEAHRRDIFLMKELGCNFIRISHFPQDDAILEMCDELGLLAWEEIPIINIVPNTPGYDDNCEYNLREMIRQHYNHSSVITWGYMNEILLTAPSIGKPEWLACKERTVNLAQRLEAVLKEEDPGRASVMAFNMTNLYNEIGLNLVDVVGWNLYHGWYVDKLKDFNAWCEDQHRRYPDQPMIISEWGAGSDKRLHSTQGRAFDFSIEYQQTYIEHYLPFIENTEWISGCAYWNFIDFNVAARQESMPRVNNKGLAYNNRIWKDVALAQPLTTVSDNSDMYVYFSMTENQLLALTRQYGDMDEALKNMPEVELFINGQSIGCQKIANCHTVFNVILPEGISVLMAQGIKNGKTVQDAMTIQFKSLPNIAEGDELAINVGSNCYFTSDISNLTWLPDQPYTAGGWGYIGGKAHSTTSEIYNTLDGPIYQTWREGNWSYKIDAPIGEYEIELLIADVTKPAAQLANLLNKNKEEKHSGETRFHISICGKQVETNFSPIDGGKHRTAFKRRYIIRNEHDHIVISAGAVKGEPFLAGIKVRKL